MGTTDFFQSIGRIIKKTTIYIFFAVVFGIIIVSVNAINFYNSRTAIESSRLKYDFLTEAIFDDLESFTNGVAKFKIQINGVEKTGYIDKTGAIVENLNLKKSTPKSTTHEDLEKKYAVVMDFSEGLIGYCHSLGLPDTYRHENCGFLDKNGVTSIAPIFKYVGEFNGGLANAKSDTNGKFGFINRGGEYVIPPIFTCANSFSEGYAAVSNEYSCNRLADNQKFFYIDRNGKAVSNAIFGKSFTKNPMKFVDGFAIVRINNGDFFGPFDNRLDSDEIVIDKEFKRVGKEFKSIRYLNEGLFAVKLSTKNNYKWALVAVRE
jgi:hypothetical protein